MNKFGSIKNKMLTKLTESFSSNNKKELKNILKIIKENKDFKEMYLLYENIETKYFDDTDTAKIYVDELTNILKTKSEKIKSFCNEIDKKLGNVEINENRIYDVLDILSENDHLLTIDKKVLAKKELVNFLTTKKDITESINNVYSKNESLLHTVLTNNFNVLYSNTLSESQKEELKNILSLDNENIINKVNELKENILNKVGELINESTDTEIKTKLSEVKETTLKMTPTRYNYYKLTELKNGLI